MFRTRGPGGAETCQRALIITSHDVIVGALFFRQELVLFPSFSPRCSPLSASVFQPCGRLTGRKWKFYPGFHPEVNERKKCKMVIRFLVNIVTAFDFTFYYCTGNCHKWGHEQVSCCRVLPSLFRPFKNSNTEHHWRTIASPHGSF